MRDERSSDACVDASMDAADVHPALADGVSRRVAPWDDGADSRRLAPPALPPPPARRFEASRFEIIPGRNSPSLIGRPGDGPHPDEEGTVRGGVAGALRGALPIGAAVDVESDEKRARATAAASLPRLDRTKSWGTERIDRFREEEALARANPGFARGPQPRVPLFSRLRYVLHFGEPIAPENIHLADDAWVAKMLSRDNWWIIHPYSHFRRQWDLFMIVCLMYVALMLPFVIGFEVSYGERSPIYALDRIADACFILDVGLNYVTGYTSNDRSRVVLEPRRVAWHYTTTWMPLDVIASVPFDLIFVADDEGSSGGAYRGAKFVRVAKLLRLVKLFRMLRLNRILHRLERRLSIKYGLWQVIKFAFAVACLAHWQACAWFLLHVLENRGDGGITWVEALADGQGGTSLDLKPRFAQYVTCVYWSITTMTTIGYGDVVPSNRDERLFTVCAELAGSCVFLYGLTQVTQLIANFNVADVEFQRLMDQANEYFEFRNIPLPLRVKVREFFHYKRAGSLFHAEDELLSHLSDDIRVEVQLWSMRDVLNAVPFLREADERFVKLIVERLVRKVYAPREIVVRQGDVGHEMYFVAHGEVEVIAGGRRVAYLNEGAMIGEIAVAMRTRRTATVRTVTFTELLALSRPHFQRAARLVPETALAMVGYAVARLRVALWKRVAEKVRLIAAVNAIRTNAGFDTLGDADAAKREFARVSSASARLSLSRTTSRMSFAARNRETSDCADQLRLARAFSAQNGIGGSPVSTAAEATMTRRGPDAGHPMGESHRSVHSDSPSPLAFFDAAAGASGGAWRLGAASAADAEGRIPRRTTTRLGFVARFGTRRRRPRRRRRRRSWCWRGWTPRTRMATEGRADERRRRNWRRCSADSRQTPRWRRNGWRPRRERGCAARGRWE